MNYLKRVVKVIEQLEDLKKQATLERSHYYTKAVIDDTLPVLYDYLKTLGENK